jgi:hypothetical protein
MDLPSALQQLNDYSSKNSRASRQIFESGVVIFRNDALHKLGDDSTFPGGPPPHAPTADHSTLGWQCLESLALAAVDVGRIDVAEVSSPHP